MPGIPVLATKSKDENEREDVRQSIAGLFNLIDLAQTGQLKSMIVVGMTNDREIITFQTASVCQDHYYYIGILEEMKSLMVTQNLLNNKQLDLNGEWPDDDDGSDE